MIRPSRRSEHVRYAIRNIVAEAKRLEATGMRIVYCNIGDPLKFDFVTPPHLVEAYARALRDGDNGYAPSAGLLTAREAIAADEQRRGVPRATADDVIVTSGVSEGIDLVLTALLDPGDSVLLPAPGYPLYNAIAAKLDAEVIDYHPDEARGWALDPHELAARVKGNTRAIVLCHPSNPTGAVYSRAELQAVLEIARRHELLVLSDEIYAKLLFGGTHVPTAALADDVPIVTFNGMSKAYLCCGWRLGWMTFSNLKRLPELKAAIGRLCDARLCAPTAQAVIPDALNGPQDHLDAMMKKLHARREVIVSRLGRIPGLSVTKPEAAFYVMPRIDHPRVKDDEQWVLELLRETGVLFVHGSGFGQKPGTRHFRVVFLPPEDVLDRAGDLVEQFMRARYPL